VPETELPAKRVNGGRRHVGHAAVSVRLYTTWVNTYRALAHHLVLTHHLVARDYIAIQLLISFALHS
jgi:hypothetical protein